MDEPLEKNIEKMRRQSPSGFAPPIAQLLGIRAVAFDEGQAVLELEAEGRHANPMGTMHGGVLCDLADLAMGVACYSTLAGEESFTTLELKINFLKPIWTGRLTARAEVKKGGRTTAFLVCEIHDDKDSLVAVASSTCMILRGDAARGR
ncbi:MAG TPA: PaaI family thioesterase [Vicinamibacteria bacterium]|nr:PaaI family thioesterase [Vicinamibacteria bacterium]